MVSYALIGCSSYQLMRTLEDPSAQPELAPDYRWGFHSFNFFGVCSGVKGDASLRERCSNPGNEEEEVAHCVRRP